jgi:hypothetical protein
MPRYEEEGSIAPSRLEVNKRYKIKRRDEANPGRNKMVPFEYMGSDTNPYPLKFRYLETDEIVRYQAAPASYPNAVIREGANGPTYIYPYEETLRNAVLRSVPPGTFYDQGTSPEHPPTIADPYSRDIATDIGNSVRKESGQLRGDDIPAVQGDPGGGTLGAKRRRKTKKSRKSKKRKNTRRY